MSTDTMHSRSPRAASSRAEFGVDSTGLPAMVTRARICPSPGVSISSAMHHGRQLTEGLRQLAHPAGAAVQAHLAAEAGLAPGVAGAGRRLGEHGAAGTVEVAGEHVEHVDEPRREGAELGGGGADAPVDAGGGRGGELAGQPADRPRRRGPWPRPRPPGVNGAAASTTSSRPVTSSAQRAEVDEPLARDHLHHRHQQVGVGAGPDRAPTRWPSPRCASDAGRPPRPCRRARSAARAGPASRARWPASRSTRTGWRRA